jgi:hypothetical protein
MSMTPMPTFWRCLCRDGLRLDDHLAWSFWRALSHSSWTLCAEFRASLLRYDTLPAPRPEADRQRVRELMTPEHLVRVVEALIQQRLLLRRDGVVIEEALLALAAAHGQWKHLGPQGLKGGEHE